MKCIIERKNTTPNLCVPCIYSIEDYYRPWAFFITMTSVTI